MIRIHNPIHMNTCNHAPGGQGCATLIGCSPSAGPLWRAHSCATPKPSSQRRTRYLRTSTIAIHLILPCCFILQLSAMPGEDIFARFTLYRVLVCREHRCAVYGLDEHLKRHHRNMPIPKRRELLDLYKDFHRLPPAEVVRPAPYGAAAAAAATIQTATAQSATLLAQVARRCDSTLTSSIAFN
jgi:hypothetical protein